MLRLDAEARGSAQRLLAQERAARAAEAESAALAERARIAREIHDVLAHSLSAQLVHLEAARLLIERGRGAGTRSSSGSWRPAGWPAKGWPRPGRRSPRCGGRCPRWRTSCGSWSPTEGGAEVTVAGERRPLPAEASQAVRRVAQEALTNVRKHAPGAKVRVRLEYGEHRSDAGGKGLGRTAGRTHRQSGAGYGLLGMRERAELLGGTLEAGPARRGSW